MTKFEVEEQRLCRLPWIVHLSRGGDLLTLRTKLKSEHHTVDMATQTKYLGRHGNADKVSHSAESSIHQQFLEIVDMNSQPNGRSADSTIYFSPHSNAQERYLSLPGASKEICSG